MNYAALNALGCICFKLWQAFLSFQPAIFVAICQSVLQGSLSWFIVASAKGTIGFPVQYARWEIQQHPQLQLPHISHHGMRVHLSFNSSLLHKFDTQQNTVSRRSSLIGYPAKSPFLSQKQIHRELIGCMSVRTIMKGAQETRALFNMSLQKG